MIAFLPQCFPDSVVDSIDPLVWLLIALALIGGVLLLAVLVTIEYRKRRQKSQLEATLQRSSKEKTIEMTTATTMTSFLEDNKQRTSENQ